MQINYENGKQKTSKKKLLVIIAICFPLVFKYLTVNNDSLVFHIIFILAVFGVLTHSYLVYKSRFKNLFKLYVLAILIVLIFPLLHAILFKIDKNNYAYNDEYLSYKTRLIESDLEGYQDYKTLEDILNNSNKKFLRSKVENSDIGSVFDVNNVLLKVNSRKNMRRPVDRDHDGYTAKTLTIYSESNTNVKIGSFHIIDETIEIAIKNKLSERNELLKLNKNPISSIRFRDVWIECSTGFLLSNMRPISNLAQILQLIQIFLIFVTATIVGNYISSVKSLTITRKDT